MAFRRRVVFDTNVLISALLSGSLPRRALFSAASNDILVVSVHTLAELEGVILRDKFARWLSVDVRKEFLVRYKEIVELVSVVSSMRICRDPRDDKFLDLAVDGNVHAIVTGDEDLLSLDPFRGIRLLTPQAFLALSKNKS